MPQDILCPQCNKKFRVGDRPPATYNCTQCGLLMDLTPFGGKDRSAKPRGPARRGPSRGGARRRGPPARGAYDEREDGRFERPPPKSNAALIIAIVAVVVAGVLIVVATSGGDPPTRKIEKTEVVDVPDEPYAPELTGDDKGTVPQGPKKPKKKRKPRLGRVELQTLPWPEEVDDATKQRVEESIQEMYRGSRDSLDARDWLIAQGRPICGRLISEFKSIRKSPGFDNREGASMCMVIDGTLRAIDGQMERLWEEEQRIRAWGVGAGPKFIERIAKRWTWWWLEGEWQNNPREPWDPKVDGYDALEEGDGAEPADEDPEKKKPGYTKPVGRD